MTSAGIDSVYLPVDDLDAAIALYSALGLELAFRDGDRYAAFERRPIRLALTAPVDQPVPGRIAIGYRSEHELAALVGTLPGVRPLESLVLDHEQRLISLDASGNPLVFTRKGTS
ncbi:VOC family protein [Agromyces aerolatus]|uniref:VOC family protein n=1 Tax=Agromyces sp. LY-1074 TaxID=3074080 RepID=UPI00285ABAE9|nr:MULTISPECIES: hypothetical protein [unclassified Agromyces]MDR5701641.1 hypothetical protein [Agromyces sp. LY-1074]MDR5707919.1 hypothetical protein [Agromyces sp. LY-1358]